MIHRHMSSLLLCVLLAAPAWAGGLDESTLSFGRFGTVHLYRQTTYPSKVALFVSGDGGWNLGVVDMARELAGLDALVVGVDITHYLRELNQSAPDCFYPAADFENLSKFVQKSLNFPRYVQPVLVGYSSGATLVYALLVQAPPNTFKAALSLGFCPDLPLAKPLCKGNGLTWTKDPHKDVYTFLPAQNLQMPWVAFQGTIDQVCNAEAAEAYVRQVPGAKIVILPEVGHGFSVPRNWLPQFREAFMSLSREQGAPVGVGLGDLPVVEVPASSSERPQLAVVISGDGGWASIDRQLGDYLAADGLAVVGFNSLKYFWTARTPEAASEDLARLLTYYLEKWQKQEIVLIGYSLGADVLPFMAARLPADLRSKIRLVALLSPGREAAFEFHLSDWIGGGQDAHEYPIRPEIEKLRDVPMFCFYGRNEDESVCVDPLPPSVTAIPLGEGHHFGGDYAAIADRILKSLDKPQ